MNPYIDLKTITDNYYSTGVMPSFDIFENLLLKHQIKLRNKDGDPIEATFSVPKSTSNGLVLGIRYKKKDCTYSEDLFLFEANKTSVRKGYKGELEKILPEYRGTHKLQRNT